MEGDHMRIILYTGKGGVGKTSIAAATACLLADAGQKVLIMSTDQAHSLGDSFDLPVESRPTAIMSNLDALEIDTVAESEWAWGSLQDYLKQLLTLKSEQSIETEELLVFPGLEELFSLSKILDVYEEGTYDVLIVDCAPSGETFSLLKFPEMLGQFIEGVLPVKRKAVKAVGPLVEKMTKIPMPEDNVFTAVEKLMDRLGRLQELMLDKDTVSIRLVTTAERVVIKETKRNFTCLHMYDYNVDAVIVNKLYPEEALAGYFSKWARLQEEGLKELAESFRDVPMFRQELQKQELKSVPLLREAAGLYGGTDPMPVLHCAKIFNMQKQEGRYCLTIDLPFVDKTEMELGQKGEDLFITIKNERRIYTLPDVVKGKEIERAKLEEGQLHIVFS